MVIIQYESDLELALSTLGAATGIVVNTKIDSSRLNGFRVAKTRIAATLTGKTAGEGPIAWGLSANLSAAEIKAIIEADPQDKTRDDSRGVGAWLTYMGIIPLEMTAGGLTGPAGGGAAGHPVQMEALKVNWSILEGKGFNVWAFNMDTGALTGGTIITCVMENMGVWLND